ncbi:hypothetical protein [Halostella sp. PRR32]|uniref:DUF7389 domain-containing protein n=1 Tax=Halostella sp. PRR32 TaxID=3098147 RepID=UPI002B1D2523|nr:hypothetical protein [Halostella sp. PRR32]
MTDVDEKVERTDVGVSVEIEMKRGSGTRDQDKIKAKVKAETLGEAKADLDELKPYLREYADDLRAIQPTEDDD